MREFLERHPFENELERSRALAILERAEARTGTPCAACASPLRGQEVVESVVLGYQEHPRCHGCHAAEHGEDPGAFLERMREYVDRVPCFRATWSWCGERLGAIEGEGGDR